MRIIAPVARFDIILLLLASSLFANATQAATPEQIKQDQITVLNAHLQTFNLDGSDRTGYDPYAAAFAPGDLQLQTEATAMALYYGGVGNLGLSSAQLQEIYDFFAYMLDVDGWLYSDYKTTPGREFKKALHNAWSLIAVDILIDNGIVDSAGIQATVVNALEAAFEPNGYMLGDPDGHQGLRTKFIQSLPFLFKVASDLGDTGAIAEARTSIDFYMANCIDGNFDIWRIDENGAKTVLINAHEAMEFTHGLLLFHGYETDATRKTTLQNNIIGIINRYSSSNWTFVNTNSEAYMATAGVAGTVNTLALFQFQFIISDAHEKGWTTNGNAAQYLDIYDTIKMTGFGDPERDNNFFYLADPDDGSSISANINSYLPGYAIAAIDSQFAVTPLPLGAPITQLLLVLAMGGLGLGGLARRRGSVA